MEYYMDNQELRLNALLFAERLLGKTAPSEKIFELATQTLNFIENNPGPIVAKNSDVVNWVKNNIKIDHPVRGSIPFNLHLFQENTLNIIDIQQNVIINTARQQGTSTLLYSYMLWYAITYPGNHIVLGYSKLADTYYAIQKIRYMYDFALENTKLTHATRENLRFDNGSEIIGIPINGNAPRGRRAMNMLVIDNAAYISHKYFNDFWTSAIPSLATGAKVIISSNPNKAEGLFYNLYSNKPPFCKNSFIKVAIPWYKNPDKDAEWEKRERANLGDTMFEREHNCQFLNT